MTRPLCFLSQGALTWPTESHDAVAWSVLFHSHVWTATCMWHAYIHTYMCQTHTCIYSTYPTHTHTALYMPTACSPCHNSAQAESYEQSLALPTPWNWQMLACAVTYVFVCLMLFVDFLCRSIFFLFGTYVGLGLGIFFKPMKLISFLLIAANSNAVKDHFAKLVRMCCFLT